MNIRNTLIAIANEFQNDYLTLETFADHKGLTVEQAMALITLAQNVRASKHPEE